MDGWMDWWINGGMEWKDGWMYERVAGRQVNGQIYKMDGYMLDLWRWRIVGCINN